MQSVAVEEGVWVANMVGQRGIRREGRNVPIRYEAVEAALAKVADEAAKLNATAHMPRIGCGLAGGKWERIEPIIRLALSDRGVEVFVYDLT